jgi:cyclopropane fatty-acyl-phospholipid synthase-like methyltransferase
MLFTLVSVLANFLGISEQRQKELYINFFYKLGGSRMPHLYQESKTERIAEYAFVLKELELEEGIVLDVGCGESSFPIMLASLGYKTYALDIHDFHWKHPNCEYVRADARQKDLTPVKNNTVDRITIISALEHFGVWHYGKEDDGDLIAIRRLSRLLSGGGKMLVTVPYGEVYMILGRYTRSGNYFFRIYDDSRIDYVFEGLHEEKRSYFIEKDGSWIRADRDNAKVNYEQNEQRVRSIVCLKFGV